MVCPIFAPRIDLSSHTEAEVGLVLKPAQKVKELNPSNDPDGLRWTAQMAILALVDGRLRRNSKHRRRFRTNSYQVAIRSNRKLPCSPHCTGGCLEGGDAKLAPSASV